MASARGNASYSGELFQFSGPRDRQTNGLSAGTGLWTSIVGHQPSMTEENQNLETMSRPDAEVEKDALARIERDIERILEELRALRADLAGLRG